MIQQGLNLSVPSIYEILKFEQRLCHGIRLVNTHIVYSPYEYCLACTHVFSQHTVCVYIQTLSILYSGQNNIDHLLAYSLCIEQIPVSYGIELNYEVLSASICRLHSIQHSFSMHGINILLLNRCITPPTNYLLYLFFLSYILSPVSLTLSLSLSLSHFLFFFLFLLSHLHVLSSFSAWAEVTKLKVSRTSIDMHLLAVSFPKSCRRETLLNANMVVNS